MTTFADAKPIDWVLLLCPSDDQRAREERSGRKGEGGLQLVGCTVGRG